MERRRAWGSGLAVAGLVAVLGSVGCGQMTIRTWVTVIEDESGGFVSVLMPGSSVPTDFDIVRLQGGFLTTVTLNTAELPGAMHGNLVLEDVRLAGEVEGLIGKLCTWNDPAGSSGGPLTVDLLGGSTETDVFLDAKATTGISQMLGMPPVDFEEAIDFSLGSGLGIDEFLAAFEAGTADGLFESETTIASTMNLAGIQATFAMNTTVTNGAEPPSFDADLLSFCGPSFDSQTTGGTLFYGLNAKSGYLRHLGLDRPKAPLVISLADVGAEVGDTLRLDSVGTYSMGLLLKDGTDTRLGAVFSSTDVVLDSSQLKRIPGAIDAGPNVNTWPSIVCIFWYCKDLGGDDIAQDFPVDPSRTLVVPNGAQYLVVAPIDSWRTWADNTGMGFGVRVEVNP